mgnify:CR=1 FL=1
MVSIFAILIIYVLVQINLPKNPTDSAQVIFKVEQGNGIEDIAKSLKDKGLINDANIFALYARFGPSRGNLKPGVYSLSPSMSLASIADTIGAGKIATKKVTFQEGLTIEGPPKASMMPQNYKIPTNKLSCSTEATGVRSKATFSLPPMT